MTMKNNSLSDEQKAVLFDKATEAPFTGMYLDNKKTGMYSCANCNAQLFSSDTKFDSGCGWPSFDQAIPGAVSEIVDTSHGMSRTEIVCAKCGGHLGHVFDDGPVDTTGLRYCVNSLSLDFLNKEDEKND
jgi:peptide-methionine (R)-S-oxide reductase